MEKNWWKHHLMWFLERMTAHLEHYVYRDKLSIFSTDCIAFWSVLFIGDVAKKNPDDIDS